MTTFASLLAATACLLLGTPARGAPATDATPTRITIVPLREAGKPDIRLAFVAPGDQRWSSGKPLFELAEKKSEFRARGFAAWSDAGVHLSVTVTDNLHLNKQTESSIWNGDFVRVGIDGWGDGSRGAPRDLRGPFGPDDKSFGFALTTSGPVGWDFGADKPVPTTVTRDDGKHTTQYDIVIPWASIGVAPLALPALGLAVTVRDADQDHQRDVPLLNFGEGAGALAAGGFKLAALAERPVTGNAFGIFPIKSTLWTTGEEVLVQASLVGAGGATLEASCDGQTARQIVKAGGAPSTRRFLVRVSPGSGPEAASVTVRVSDDAGGKPIEETLAVTIPRRLVASIEAQVDSLVASATHPLFRRHLTSVKALTLNEWARTQSYREADPVNAEKTVRHLRSIEAGLRGDAAKFESYLTGDRSLILAFVSKRDRSLQQYVLTMPKGWNPKLDRNQQKAFPLFVELHGAGDDHPLGNTADIVGPKGGGARLLGYEARIPYPRQVRIGYHLEPFGRGNSRYADIGEIDVWEAYEDVRAQFAIDEDRQYLFGFSMGGAGTFALASRTPDRWAAITILGAAPRPAGWGQAENLASLPTFAWAGEFDEYAMAGFADFEGGLRAGGVKLLAKRTPKVGHNYLYSIQKETIDFLAQHRRQRPAKFSFAADTDQHTGGWGIQMKRNVAQAGVPRFSYAITGNTVAITSSGTSGLTVDLGKQGLRMSGKVTVTWNCKPVFDGVVNDALAPLELKD